MEQFFVDWPELNQSLDEWEKSITAPDEEVYHCPLCRDTGFVSDGENAYPCACQQEKAQAVRRLRSGLPPLLRRCTLQNFRLDVYEDLPYQGSAVTYRQLAEKALTVCRDFVADYPQTRQGIMISGATGSGKTHLAAAMANELMRRGADVLFLVVPEFLDQLRGSYRRENDGLDESAPADLADAMK